MRCDRVWINARLVTLDPAGQGLGEVDHGVIAALDGRIAYAGAKADAPGFEAAETINCEGRWITPGLIDPHTHLVFAGDRAHEFELRLAGASYEAIARAGGGIVSTMTATRAASEDDLVLAALPRLDALIAEGVTTVEIKSGYGLSLDDELKCLRAARALADCRPVDIRTTLLGAHALPPEFKGDPDGYIDLVCKQMIPAVADVKLADAVDVFCEGIGFTPAQTRRVFEAAHRCGLKIKIHAEQLSNQNGAALAAEFWALSADHLEHLDQAAVEAMAAAGTVVPSLAHRLRPHLAFNLGRILGFGILGALLGLLGSSMSLPTRLTAVLVLGVAVVMSLLGVRLTGMSPRMAAWSPRLPGGLARTLGIDAAAGGSYSDVRAGVVGALTFFLPCGFTQAVQIYAISTASPLTAGLVMATFAVGTTPGLLALATVPEIATGERRTTVLRVVGVVVLAFALLNVSSGLNLLGISRASSASVASAGAAGQQASANVTISNGVQTVAMTQTPRGYEPADTVLYSGLPTTWSITATSPYDCSAFLRVPDLGQQINLTMGVNTVSLPAMEAGVVPFTCVMGMYSGNLIVVDPPATGAATKAGGQL